MIGCLIGISITAGITGYQYAVAKYRLGDINAYITESFPNEWQAYKRGVDEGYAQGLQDGQEIGQ